MTNSSPVTVRPVQLEFEFMRNMRPQLSPAAEAREFATLRRSVGGERSDRRGTTERSS
jgi:hypothetical protein